jgi:acyl-CoA reductase-like NAD-dependent aldehyde dehydrogenase
VGAARKAFDKGPWRRLDCIARRNMLNKYADLMEKNGDELAALESLDNGKPLFASKIDVALGVEIMRYFAA